MKQLKWCEINVQQVTSLANCSHLSPRLSTLLCTLWLVQEIRLMRIQYLTFGITENSNISLLLLISWCLVLSLLLLTVTARVKWKMGQEERRILGLRQRKRMWYFHSLTGLWHHWGVNTCSKERFNILSAI